ncbi:Imm26 family immunity protein [Flavobacterium tyrosinilyticum]|uniref:Imm26 family immunity protein n=1 Tax=Flavobacterium tyrosinilyticum TaxID=1658740 RepID=UPI002030D8B5|nr:Imm26 family immunity protein [Flavobacterium tyrosinilyticum]MCM0665515.1 immunity 26/phosphotriesterase HocA family protein [Flavobacterium tyrosinilyticum]
MKIKAGILFCIPLFMERNDWKLKVKLSEDDLDKHFAFGRVIETSSSVLVEIFKKTGSAKTDINEIINSGIMFSPVQIFWDGIVKKRWRIIGQTEDYEKIQDSNYNNLKMVYGMDEDFRLRDLSTEKECNISREDIEKYEFSTVWFPIDLEKRILEKISESS